MKLAERFKGEKMDKIIESIRIELKSQADEKTRLQGERFFREPVKMYGLRSAQTTAIAKSFYAKLRDKNKKEVFKLCHELWRSGYMEESFVACSWSYNVRKQFEPDDFVVFGEWVNKYVDNWASCDTLCNHTVGTIVEMYPSLLNGLKDWSHSGNRWVKRASAVSLIIPARRGLFLNDIFQIAGNLHSDPDDMVQKGYGWMLKAASQAHQKEVFNYVMKMKSTMPRTALRYAIEKMPPALRAEAMAK